MNHVPISQRTLTSYIGFVSSFLVLVFASTHLNIPASKPPATGIHIRIIRPEGVTVRESKIIPVTVMPKPHIDPLPQAYPTDVYESIMSVYPSPEPTLAEPPMEPLAINYDNAVAVVIKNTPVVIEPLIKATVPGVARLTLAAPATPIPSVTSMLRYVPPEWVYRSAAAAGMNPVTPAKIEPTLEGGDTPSPTPQPTPTPTESPRPSPVPQPTPTLTPVPLPEPTPTIDALISPLEVPTPIPDLP